MSIADACWLSLYAAILYCCGAAIQAVLRPREHALPSPAETIAINLAAGLGGLPGLLLTLSMLGLQPTHVQIIIVGLFSAAICWLRRPRTRVSAARFPLRAYAMPAIALLLIQAILLVGLSLSPTYEQDAVAIWGLKARVLYDQPLRPTPDYFSDLSLSFTHLDYPLLLPMLWAGAFTMLGRTDETISKLILLLPTAAIAGLIYGTGAQRVGRSMALVLAALAVGSAATTRWAAQGLADQLLAMLILAAAIALVRFIEHRRLGDGCLAGLFAGFAAVTKLEGFVLLLTIEFILLVILIATNRLGAALGLLVATAIDLPWLIWSHGLPHTHENYRSRLTPSAVAQHLPRLPEVLHSLWAHFHPATWWPILALPLAGIALNPRGLLKPAAGCVGLILLALIAADLSAYLVTPWPIDALVATTLERLLLQLTPLLMLLVTLQWPPLHAPAADVS